MCLLDSSNDTLAATRHGAAEIGGPDSGGAGTAASAAVRYEYEDGAAGGEVLPAELAS